MAGTQVILSAKDTVGMRSRTPSLYREPDGSPQWKLAEKTNNKRNKKNVFLVLYKKRNTPSQK